MPMKKNKYDITGLSQMYFPDSTEKNARRRFLKTLKSERDLWLQLAGMNFSKFQRVLTPRQYEVIIAVLGKPDSDEMDFDAWVGG